MKIFKTISFLFIFFLLFWQNSFAAMNGPTWETGIRPGADTSRTSSLDGSAVDNDALEDPTGIAFSNDGTMYVGDRSGTIFRVSASGHAAAFATLPASIAAFHLAFGEDGYLFASVPTLSSCDGIFRIDRTGFVDSLGPTFGRPQGLAFDCHGVLHVVEALAGIGLAFNQQGDMAVASSETLFRFNAT